MISTSRIKKLEGGFDNPYVKMTPVMKDFFDLYDEIEINTDAYYRAKNPSGRCGATKGVVVPRSGTKFDSEFHGNHMETQSPNGFIYPIIGAFRALLKEGNGL